MRRSRTSSSGTNAFGGPFLLRLQALTALLLIAAVSYVAHVYHDQRRFEMHLREQVERQSGTRSAAERLRVQMLRLHVRLLDALSTGERRRLEDVRRDMQDAREQAAELRARIGDPAIGAMMAGLQAEIDAYIAEAADAVRERPPRPETETGLRRRMRAIGGGADAIADSYRRLLADHRNNLRESLRTARRKVMAASALLAFAVLIGVAYQIWLLRSLTQLRQAVRRIERGDVDFELPVRRGGEVAALTYSFNEMVKSIRHRREALQRENVTDPLTGLYNQRQLRPFLEKEIERARRTGAPVSLLMIDIDHFKKVNDSLGHEVGNEVLKETARALKDNLREIDILSRYGGDEFIAILPGASKNVGHALAARLERAAAATPVSASGRTPAPVTLSIGGATLPDGADTLDDLISRADEALYAAKAAGRACVRWHGLTGS